MVCWCEAETASAVGGVAHIMGAASQGAKIAWGGVAACVLSSVSLDFVLNTLKFIFAAGRAALDVLEDSISILLSPHVSVSNS